MAAGGKDNEGMMLDEQQKLLFRFFNEVGIIQQLSAALFNRRLPDGLHVSHFAVLNHLVRLGDGKTPLQLAGAFQITKATMTHTLSALSKRDFIRLAPNEADGRSKLVFITEYGRTFHQRAIASLAPAMVALQDQLDFDALTAMLPDLEKLRVVLDNNRDV